MKHDFGLRAALRKPKGQHIWYYLKDLVWQIRYAWQRAWLGYDFTDIFELGYNFARLMPILLREFKENNVGLFYDHENNRNFTEEETDAILDELIFYFDNCDEDHVYERLFGTDSWDDYITDKDLWRKRTNVASKEYRRCWDEAMRLFAKWSGQLWY